MGEGTRNINVECPICQATKNIQVPTAIFSQKKFGTVKIQVPPGAVCLEHQFIVFIDPKGQIRGYEKIDLMMGAPVPTETSREAEEGQITLRKLLQMYGSYGIFSLLHAKIFNYPAYIMSSKKNEQLHNILVTIGDELLPEAYRGAKFEFLEETRLDKVNLKEKDKALLLDSSNNILQTPWDVKLKFEESMISKALDIFDEGEQIIILQQEIAKLLKEVEFVKNVLENVKEIYEDDLIAKISDDLKTPKINNYRLSLIKDFIRQWFSPKLASKIKNKVQEFLNLL